MKELLIILELAYLFYTIPIIISAAKIGFIETYKRLKKLPEPIESLKEEITMDIVKRVSDCFKGIDGIWNTDAFNFNGELAEGGDGETMFYSKTKIDAAIKKLNKLLEVLTNQ